MLTDLCDWASRQPESAVNEFATQSPIIVVNAGLTDEERTISGLSPVALIASPRRVFRKSPSSTATAATAIRATKSLDCLATGVPLTSAAILVNTVSVLFILSIDEPLMTAIFIEYSPVLTIIPANRLLMPILVWSIAVTKPEAIPAAIAANIDRYG